MKISLKWFFMFAIALTALLVFQARLHSQSAGTIKWANGGDYGCSGGVCTLNLSWSPSAFSDVNYTASCSAFQGSANLSWSIASETASQISILVQSSDSNSGASVSSFQCIAVHN